MEQSQISQSSGSLFSSQTSSVQGNIFASFSQPPGTSSGEVNPGSASQVSQTVFGQVPSNPSIFGQIHTGNPNPSPRFRVPSSSAFPNTVASPFSSGLSTQDADRPGLSQASSIFGVRTCTSAMPVKSSSFKSSQSVFSSVTRTSSSTSVFGSRLGGGTGAFSDAPSKFGHGFADERDKLGGSAIPAKPSEYSSSQSIFSQSSNDKASSLFGQTIPGNEQSTTPYKQIVASPSVANRKRPLHHDDSVPGTSQTPVETVAETSTKKRTLRDTYAIKAMLLAAKKKSSPFGKSANQLTPKRVEPSALGLRTRKASTSLEIAEQIATATAIVCHDIPDGYNNQTWMRQHFMKYGDILKVLAHPERNTATISFRDHKMAAAAKAHGAYISETDSSMKIFFAKKGRKSTDRVPQVEKLTPSVKHTSKFDSTKFPKSQTGISARGATTSAIYARSDSEKLALLDKIDVLLRKRIVKQSDINKAKTCAGTCPDMCPEKERYLRQERKILAMYETSGEFVDHAKAVKEYSRSSADQEEPLPHELRPANVLQMTMHYLLIEMMPKLHDGQVADWYDFLWNRTRAIRKELTIQQIKDVTAVNINEQCARFHIFCAHELSGQDRMVFDPKINNENLEKTMKTVMDLYQDLYFATSEGHPNLPLENSHVAELYGYYIMLNINKTADVLNELQELSSVIRRDPNVVIAVEAFMALHSNDYVKFFKSVRRATFLQGCILHRYFTQVRKTAMSTICKAFSVSQDRKTVLFPAEDFIRILNFNDFDDLRSFCNHFGVSITSDEMVELQRSGLSEPEGGVPIVPSNEVRRKVNAYNIAEVIASYPLTPEHHIPYSSFDENGRYVGQYSSLLVTTKTFPEPTPKIPQGVQNLPLGISAVDIKNIAKELFLEVIDDMCITVAKESCNDASTNIIFSEIFEETITESSHAIARTVLSAVKEEKLREEAAKRRMEEERKRKELIAREERRQRELKILEEKRERERLEKEKQEEIARAQQKISVEVANQIQEEVVTSDAKQLVEAVMKKQKIKMWSEDEYDDIERNILNESVSKICNSIWKEMKIALCTQLHDRFLLGRSRRLFKRWRTARAAKTKLRTVAETFPCVPFSRSPSTQIHELLPNQEPFCLASKRHSFPLDMHTEVSLRSPMDIVSSRSKCLNLLLKTGTKLEKLYDAAERPIPFCTVLENVRKKQGFNDKNLKWKIGLRIPDTLSNAGLESTFYESFFDSKKNTCIFTGPDSISVCCHKVSKVDARSDLMGCYSLVLGLPKPAEVEPDRRFWEIVQDELEFLICNRPPVPPISLLIVLIGWHCDEDEVHDELGLSLLSFAFPRWAICSFSDDVECVLENHKNLTQGVEFLFEDLPELPKLTTVKLRDFLEDFITKEYVTPVSQHISNCKQMFLPPMHPAMQVKFYNFLIESLANAVNMREFSEISWPPKEFLEDDNSSSPKHGWNDEENLTRNFSIMMKCKLPAFPEDFAVKSPSDIYRLAQEYAELSCPECPAIITLVNQRVVEQLHKFNDEIYLDEHLYSDEEELLELFDWRAIINDIISQHLTNILYLSEAGEIQLTFPDSALQNVEKYNKFEDLLMKVDYATLNEPSMGNTISVRPEFSDMFDDPFSHLEYSLPSHSIDVSWMDDTAAPAIKESEDLVEEIKVEKRVNDIYNERLAALVNEGGMELGITQYSELPLL